MLPQHIYACNLVVITLVCPTKVSIMKLKCNLLSRMWQHAFLMKQIFFSSIFLSENKGRLAKQAGYLGHNPWHTRYLPRVTRPAMVKMLKNGKTKSSHSNYRTHVTVFLKYLKNKIFKHSQCISWDCVSFFPLTSLNKIIISFCSQTREAKTEFPNFT
jgi:hypothetical protein